MILAVLSNVIIGRAVLLWIYQEHVAVVSLPAVSYPSVSCKVLPHSCLTLRDPTLLPSTYPAQFKVKLNRGIIEFALTWFRGVSVEGLADEVVVSKRDII